MVSYISCTHLSFTGSYYITKYTSVHKFGWGCQIVPWPQTTSQSFSISQKGGWAEGRPLFTGPCIYVYVYIYTINKYVYIYNIYRVYINEYIYIYVYTFIMICTLPLRSISGWLTWMWTASWTKSTRPKTEEKSCASEGWLMMIGGDTTHIRDDHIPLEYQI